MRIPKPRPPEQPGPAARDIASRFGDEQDPASSGEDRLGGALPAPGQPRKAVHQGEDGRPGRRSVTRRTYSSRFSSWKRSAWAVGEASTNQLFCAAAAIILSWPLEIQIRRLGARLRMRGDYVASRGASYLRDSLSSDTRGLKRGGRVLNAAQGPGMAFASRGRGDLPGRAGAGGRLGPAERGRLEPGAFVLFIPNPNPGKSGEDSAWASRVRTPLEYSLTLSRPRRRSSCGLFYRSDRKSDRLSAALGARASASRRAQINHSGVPPPEPPTTRSRR